jgi:hypothetical protein
MDRKCLYLSNESGSETWRSESVQISRTKLGVRPGDQEVSTSLEQNWEWSECVHISRTKLGVRPGGQEVSISLKTKLGVRPGDQEVSKSLERNWE